MSYIYFLISFSISVFFALIIFLTKNKTYSLFGDSFSGAQKVHELPTPRVGGIAVFMSFFITLFILNTSFDIPIPSTAWMVISLPVFLTGLGEDLLKSVSPRARLVMAFVSAVLSFFMLDIGIRNTGFDYFDYYILGWKWQSIAWGSLLLSSLAIAGLAHAINVIDGYNGLMPGYALIVLTLMLSTSLHFGAYNFAFICIILMGAIFGLLIFNFPFGLIFTGDGGAYFIGLILGILAINLSQIAPISPWLLMLWLMYPGMELLFSIIRKKVEGKSPFEPDSYHLHLMLLPFYQTLFPTASLRKVHALITVSLLTMFLPAQIIGLLFLQKTITLICIFFTMAIIYLFIYFCIRNFTKTKIIKTV